MSYNKVAVIGGGTLGSQIAFMCAFNGKDTYIWGRSEGSLDRAKSRVGRWETAIQKDLDAPKEKVDASRKNLHYTTNLAEALKGTDLAIEALTEDPKTKNDFYEKFKKVADSKTDIVTNTSTLLPSDFAEATGRPAQYMGYHFANSIWKNNTAEIMSQSKTNPEMPKKLETFSREIGMVPIMVNKEQPGYLLNSLLVPFLEDALLLWDKGVADPETIDKTWMIGTGAPHGPFGIMDIIGMNTMYAICKIADDPKIRKAAERYRKMIDANELGKESGKGFYTYPNPAFADPYFLTK